LGYISWFWGFVFISCVLTFDAMRLLIWGLQCSFCVGIEIYLRLCEVSDGNFDY
jgi:hypothetical protein